MENGTAAAVDAPLPGMEEVEELVRSLGLGGIPILSQENRSLYRSLAATQLESSQLKAEAEKEDDEVVRLHNHNEEVGAAAEAAKGIIAARREEARAERDLEKIAVLERERNGKDGAAIEDATRQCGEKVEDLEEIIETTRLVLEAMDEEYRADRRTLDEWAEAAKDVEANIFELLKCQTADENRVKELHLKIVSFRESMAKSKAELDESSTGNKMAQVALDKTAEEYRRLHKERQAVADRWNEAVATVQARDEELRQLLERVDETKGKVREKAMEYQEQLGFLNNEKENNRELERKIADLERTAGSLGKTLEAREDDLRACDGELVLEEGEISKLKSEIDAKRGRLKDVKETKTRMTNRVKMLEAIIQEAIRKRAELKNSALTAEEMLKEMDRLLEGEVRRRDVLKWDLEKLRERKFRSEQSLKELRDELGVVRMRTKAFALERDRASEAIAGHKGELAKKEELAAANDFKISQLERRIAKMKGTMSPENRAELKKELDALKAELAEKSADKRNVDHLLHKIASEVRKMSRAIEQLEKEKETLGSKLEEVTLETETSKKHHKLSTEKVEALLLEEKLLMVNEKKARQELKETDEALVELKKQIMREDEETQRRRGELESQRELAATQQRHLQDDLRAIRTEIRERRDQADKLKIKYDYLVKALSGRTKVPGGEGAPESEEKEVASHAYHLVTLAQEKAELQDKIEDLRTALAKEESEMEALERAALMLKDSNHKFRSDTFGRAHYQEDSDEVKELKAKRRETEDRIKQIRSEIEGTESRIKQREAHLFQVVTEMDQAAAVYEDRLEKKKQLEKEMTEQEDKLARARKSVAALSSSLKAAMPEAELYEQDMDLRSEKERQRSAMIKLQELSSADRQFGASCNEATQKIGLSAPAMTRLEMQVASSTAKARARSATRFGRFARSAEPAASLYRRSSSSTKRVSYSASGATPKNVLIMEFSRSTTSLGATDANLAVPY